MGKRLQFVFILTHTFLDRHRIQILIGIIAGFFVTLFIIQFYPYFNNIAGPKTQRIALVGRFNENNLPAEIKNKISFGLTSLLPSGEATSSIASSWDIDSTGLNYTFHIKNKFYWHDGAKFSVSDINYKIKGLTYTYPDAETVKITLKDPFVPLPVNLSFPIIKSGFVGLGIYKVQKTEYSNEYLSEITLQSLQNNLPDLVYKFYPTLNDALLAFKLGEVDKLENIPQLNDINEWKNINITKIPQYDKITLIFFNLKNSLFKEKEIRQALTYAIPQFEGFEKAYTPISPISWAYTKKIRLYKYDPETAIKLLSKSEISSSSTQITLSTYSSLLNTAQSVADAWNKVGVDTKVKIEPIIPSDYQAFLLTLSIPPDPDQYQYWQTKQENTNIGSYSNLKIDKLLEDGRKTQDMEKRVKIYADFQRYLVDDAPVIFLYHPNLYTVERK